MILTSTQNASSRGIGPPRGAKSLRLDLGGPVDTRPWVSHVGTDQRTGHIFAGWLVDGSPGWLHVVTCCFFFLFFCKGPFSKYISWIVV